MKLVPTVLGLVLLAALGVLLAVVGAFLVPLGPRIGGSPPLSLGDLLAVAGNAVAAWLGLAMTRSRGRAALPLVTWTVVTFVLMASQTNGSYVFAAGDLTVPSYLFPVLGLIGGTAALVAARLPRPDPPG